MMYRNVQNLDFIFTEKRTRNPKKVEKGMQNGTDSLDHAHWEPQALRGQQEVWDMGNQFEAPRSLRAACTRR